MKYNSKEPKLVGGFNAQAVKNRAGRNKIVLPFLPQTVTFR
tara:strand:+ start:1204 stop:1326 length:123 start_codon:yes stop_codon:yes gene_type:complete